MRKVLRDVHEAARDLAKSGVLPETTMREFDALCLPAVKAYGAKNVRRIRRKERVSSDCLRPLSQCGKTTVQQWEQGLKQPNGASLRFRYNRTNVAQINSGKTRAGEISTLKRPSENEPRELEGAAKALTCIG